MADLTITAGNVQRVSGNIQRRTAGATISAGDSVYIDSNNQLQLCEKDQTATEASCQGIALNNAAAGQPCSYQVSGDINLGAVLATGEVYVVGAVGGAIAPVGDVAAGNFATILGVAISSSVLRIGITASGVAAA